MIGFVACLAAFAFVWWCGFDMGRDVSYWEAQEKRRAEHFDGQAGVSDG